MTLTAKQGGTDFEKPDPGTYPARCVQVIDLGTQYSEFYKNSKHKVLIGWELAECDKSGEPFLVWKRYTLSLYNSALLDHLQSWRGRKFTKEELSGFDLANVLDKGCLVNVVHNDDGYANVQSVMALPKGTEVPPRHHDLIKFDIDNWDQAVFDSFREKLQQTIMNSAEMQGKENGPQAAAIDDPTPEAESDPTDDIPF